MKLVVCHYYPVKDRGQLIGHKIDAFGTFDNYDDCTKFIQAHPDLKIGEWYTTPMVHQEIKPFVKTRLMPDWARQDGFIIDDTTYPWLAYKGLRFAPTESHDCYTALEAELISARHDPLLTVLTIENLNR